MKRVIFRLLPVVIVGAVLLAMSALALASSPTSTATPAPDAIPAASPPTEASTTSTTLAPGPALREVTIALGSEPDTLYPYGSYMRDAATVRQALMDDSVTTIDYAYQPVILTTIPDLSNGGVSTRTVTVTNGMSYWDENWQAPVTYSGPVTTMTEIVITFTMRSDVRWSDGVALTEQDAVFGEQIGCDDSTPALPYVVCVTMGSYTSPTPFTVRWTGLPNYTDPSALRNAGSYFLTPLPYHALHGQTASSIAHGAYGRNPLGWGPFRVAEWLAGDHITVERNPYYWRTGYPLLDRVTFRWYANGDALRHAVLRNEVQVVSQYAAYSLSYAQQQALLSDGNMRLLATQALSWEHLDFGISPTNHASFFDQREVRQAVAYALDRQRMVNEVFGGQGYVTSAYVPEDHWAYTTTVPTYPYSPTLAAQMLAAAGWVDSNGDGIREKNGRPFLIDHYTADSTSRRAVGRILQENLSAVGISVTLHFLSGRSFFDSCSKGGPLYCRTFDTAEFSWFAGMEPGCSLYVSSQIPTAANGWAGQNSSAYSNPAYDAACAAAMNAPTHDASVPPFQQTTLMLADDLPMIPLSRNMVTVLAHASLNPGPAIDALQNELSNIWAWDITTHVMVTPDAGATLTGSGGSFVASFAPNTFTTTAVITFTPLFRPYLGGSLFGPGLGYNLEAVAQDNGAPLQPQQPYSVTLAFTAGQMQEASIMDESMLALYSWDGGQWVKEPSSAIDTVGNTASAHPDHLSPWALALPLSYGQLLPIIVR